MSRRSPITTVALFRNLHRSLSFCRTKGRFNGNLKAIFKIKYLTGWWMLRDPVHDGGDSCVGRPPPSTFKSRGSILKDANTSGGQAEAHTGGITTAENSTGPVCCFSGSDISLSGFSVCLWRNTDNALIVPNCPGVEREREMGGVGGIRSTEKTAVTQQFWVSRV